MNEIEQWAIDLYDWMTKKYGEENFIGFDVHLDETTAHCHATIIPVVMRTEKKTSRERPVVSYLFNLVNPPWVFFRKPLSIDFDTSR